MARTRLALQSALLAASLATTAALAQPTTTFERTYDPTPPVGSGQAVRELPEGGYITTATIPRAPDTTLAGVLKVDSLGNLLWYRGHEPRRGTGAGADAVCISLDGAYVIAGGCGGPTIGDLFVIKTDTACNLIWQYIYEGPGLDGACADLCPTSDSGCAFTTHVTTEEGGGMGVIRMSKDGDLEWARLYNPDFSLWGTSIQQTVDRGFFVGGTSYQPANPEQTAAYLVRTDAAGETLWTRTFPGLGHARGLGGCLTQNGGFVVGGATAVPDSAFTAAGYLVRVDSAGNLLWERYYRTANTRDSGYYFRRVAQSPDGGFVVTGEWFDYTTPRSIIKLLLLRVDSLGCILWERHYEAASRELADFGYGVEATRDNGIVVSGEADDRNIYLIKTDSLGLVHYCDLRLSGWRFNDAAGNGNGRPDPGETASLIVTYANSPGFWDADRIRARLSTTSTGVTVVKDTATFPDIPAGASGDCSADSFVVTVDANTPPQDIRFSLSVTARPDVAHPDTSLLVRSGVPRTLVVDDDLGLNYEQYFASACDSNGIVYDVFETQVLGPPSSDTLLRYAVVIWNTGNDSVTSLTASEQAALGDYLDAGGSLLLSGKKVAQDLRGSGFLADWLRAAPAIDSMGRLILVGLPADPISEGDTMVITGADGAANGADANGIRPTGGAQGGAFFRDFPDTTVQGLVHYRGAYRLVFFAAPFEAVDLSPARYLQRWTLISRIYRFFGEATPGTEEPAAPLPTATRLTLVVLPNPFARSAHVRFSSPVAGPVRLRVYNSAGQLVCADTRTMVGPGTIEFTLDGTRLSNGVYIVRVTSTAGTAGARMTVLR